MIPRSEPAVQSESWQKILQQSSISLPELLQRLDLDPEQIAPAASGLRQFPLRVPPAYLGQIRRGDPQDPLLRQILPLMPEDNPAAGFNTDPVGDLKARKQPGLLHKYHGRVLLTLTGACAIHCRYCFRRHFPYAESNPARGAWPGIQKYLLSDTSITEVILSGGDPLSLPDNRLAALSEDLQQVPHLKRLRIHSRMPTVLPERVTDTFIKWLSGLSLQPVLVVHINHPREINNTAAAGLRKLHQAGIHLLNQSVLLKDVNDSAETLTELSELLFANDVLPYYLHLLDRVKGAAHYDVEETTAIKLVNDMRMRLPGYLVPRLVREDAGMPYKTPVL